MDHVSSGVPTDKAIPIAATEAADIPSAEVSNAYVVPNHLKLQPGTFGANQVSMTRLDLTRRAELVAAINVAGARYASLAVDQQPGAIKRAVKDVTADPLFQEKLKEAEVKGLKAYELFSASQRTYEATQKLQVQDLLLPTQQEDVSKLGRSISSSDEAGTTLPIEKEGTSSSDQVDRDKKLSEQHEENLKAGKRANEKAHKKSEKLLAKQKQKTLDAKKEQLAKIAAQESQLAGEQEVKFGIKGNTVNPLDLS